jgi:hypothetical protein
MIDVMPSSSCIPLIKHTVDDIKGKRVMVNYQKKLLLGEVVHECGEYIQIKLHSRLVQDTRSAQAT